MVKRFYSFFFTIALLGLFAFYSQAQTNTPTPTNTPTATNTATPTNTPTFDYDWCVVWNFAVSNGGFVNVLTPIIGDVSHNRQTGTWDGSAWSYTLDKYQKSGSGKFQSIAGVDITYTYALNYQWVGYELAGRFVGGAHFGTIPYGIGYLKTSGGFQDNFTPDPTGDFYFTRTWSRATAVTGGNVSLRMFNASADYGAIGEVPTPSPIGEASYYWLIMYGINTAPPNASPSCSIATPTPSPTPNPFSYAFPLRTEDTGPFGFIENTEASTSISNPQFTTLDFTDDGVHGFVHSLADGMIVEIRQARESDCIQYLASDSPSNLPCSIEINDGDSQYLWALNGQFSNSIPNPYIDRVMNFYYVRIDIAGDDRDAIYFVENAPNFIKVGSSVAKGCILGRTIQHSGPISYQHGSDYGIISDDWAEVTILALISTGEIIQDAYDEIVEDPPVLGPCNIDSEFSGCLGDSQLKDASQWTVENATFTGSSVLLEPSGSIQTTMNLDPDLLPEMIIYARSNLNLDFDATLGTTVQNFSVSGSLLGIPYTDYVVAADAHEPDIGSLYTIKIKNKAQYATMEINYICVRHTSGEELPPPSGNTAKCEFLNYDFRDGLDQWSYTGSVSAVTGGVRMPSGATLYQTVGSTPGDYYLAVTFSIWGDKPPQSDTTSTVSLEYEYPSGDGFNPVGSWTSQEMAVAGNKIVTKTAITISSANTVTIKPTLSSSPWGTDSVEYGITVSSVCLYPSSDSGPFVEKCAPLAAPTSEALSEWTSWHWHNLDQFFQCELMILLNKMYQQMIQTYKLIGWIHRYWMALSSNGIRWSGTRLFPWLAGYLSNISPSNVTVVSTPGCDNIFCVFVSLFDTINSSVQGLFNTLNNIIYLVVVPVLDFVITWLNVGLNLLLSIILLLITLSLFVVQEIIGLFLAGKDWLFAIIYAWNNATPTALPGMWDCVNNPTDNAVCWGLWTAENTIFSGDYGQLIIPLFTSLAYILVFISWFKRFKRIAKEIGEGL